MDTKPSLSSLERQENLKYFLEQHQRATVAEISQHLAVSAATVRRDLEAMTERGEIQRFHGGAMAVRQAPPELPALQRETEQSDEKKRIGRAAADLVQEGETVFIGSGTTALEVARNLRSRQLTVITNSLLVINALTGSDIDLVILGGVLRHTEMSMIGHLTEQALREVHAHKIIMGIRALDIERGLTNDYLPETVTDRAILSLGGKVILAADNSKCGCVSTASLAPITAIDTLVTDTGTPADFVNAFRDKNIEVIVA